MRFSIIKLVIVLGIYGSVSLLLFNNIYLTSKLVVDEEFHLPLGEAYCQFKFNEVGKKKGYINKKNTKFIFVVLFFTWLKDILYTTRILIHLRSLTLELLSFAYDKTHRIFS